MKRAYSPQSWYSKKKLSNTLVKILSLEDKQTHTLFKSNNKLEITYAMLGNAYDDSFAEQCYIVFMNNLVFNLLQTFGY